MGLAPMHTWKPDAYGEAPGIVGAMLAGGVTTVAFTALLRVRAVVDAAGEGAMAGAHAAGDRAVLDARGGAVSAGTRGLQADARLFERRAHGHPGHRRGARRRGRLGGAVSRLEQQPDQGRAVPERGQHPPRGGRAHRRRGQRHGRRCTPRSARDLRRRDVRRHRLPAVRPVLQRTARGARGVRDGHTVAAAAVFLGCLLLAFSA